jgi:putative salt-induced outer membrane protein YdiY
MIKNIVFILLIILILTTQSYATEIYLKNGDRISGDIITQDKKNININSPVFGDINIDSKYVDHIGSKPKPKPEKPPKTSPWKGEITAGYNTARGNTEKEQLTASVSIDKKRSKIDEINLKANIFYSSANKKMNAQKWYTMARYARNFGKEKKWYWFSRSEIDHDKFADIYYRAVPVAGLGYWFIDKATSKALLECAAGWEYTNYSNNKKALSTAIVTPRIYLETTFFEKLKLSTDFTYYPSLSDFSIYRFHWDTTANFKVFENMSLRFSFVDDYNAAPPAGAKKNDIQLISSAVYSF